MPESKVQQATQTLNTALQRHARRWDADTASIQGGQFDQQVMTRSLLGWWLQLANDAAEIAGVWLGGSVGAAGTTPTVILARGAAEATVEVKISAPRLDGSTRFFATRLLAETHEAGGEHKGRNAWEVIEAIPGDREVTFALKDRKFDPGNVVYSATVFADSNNGRDFPVAEVRVMRIPTVRQQGQKRKVADEDLEALTPKQFDQLSGWFAEKERERGGSATPDPEPAGGG